MRYFSSSQWVMSAACTVSSVTPGTATIAMSSRSASAWMPVRRPGPLSPPIRSMSVSALPLEPLASHFG